MSVYLEPRTGVLGSGITAQNQEIPKTHRDALADLDQRLIRVFTRAGFDT